jgi:hypothetical protein
MTRCARKNYERSTSNETTRAQRLSPQDFENLGLRLTRHDKTRQSGEPISKKAGVPNDSRVPLDRALLLPIVVAAMNAPVEAANASAVCATCQYHRG